MVFLCCGIFFVFPFLPQGCIFCCMIQVLDQASPDWVTFSFPSTNDSCMYPSVYYDSEAFHHAGIFFFLFFFPSLNCSTSFVFWSTPSNLFTESVLCTGCWVMHLKGTGHSPNLFSPPQDAILKSPLTHMSMSVSMSWIICVYVKFCVYFECLKVQTPHLDDWVELGGVVDMRYVSSQAADGEYRNINHLSWATGLTLSWICFFRWIDGSWNDGHGRV